MAGHKPGNSRSSPDVSASVDGGAPAELPTRAQAAWWRAKVTVHQARRLWSDFVGGPSRHARGATLVGAPVLATSRTPLWSANPGPEWVLEAGKVENLRRAISALDGVEVAAGRVLSFWAQVGPPWAARGFVEGREVRQGCIIPSIAGGLCQLSNALFDVADRAGLEIVERHRHSRIVPGSAAEVGRDATVMWNYVDLRIRSAAAVRIEASLEADALVIRLRGFGTGRGSVLVGRSSAPTLSLVSPPPAGTRSCLSCDQQSCHRVRTTPVARRGETAWLVDAVWPEHDAWMQAEHGRDDRLLLPMDGRRFRRPRYAWTTQGFARVESFAGVAIARAIESRRLARQGAARQRALRRFDARLAAAMARRLPASATRLVVTQTLLPHLWTAGVLGGRRFDVLMTRPPLEDLHRALDRAKALHPQSPTLGDFRADRGWMAAEREALAAAERVVTPHRAIAERFGERAVVLGWQRPVELPRDALAASAHRTKARPRVWFPASTLGRRGAYEVRDALAGLDVDLRLGGPVLEAEDFWARPVSQGSLGEADLVVSPPHVEAAPRRLLAALARGVPVIASEACGLPPQPGLTIVPVGNADAVRAAVIATLGLDGAASSVA